MAASETFVRYVDPTTASSDDTAPLPSETVRNWREKGFALVDGIFSPELVEQCLDDALELLPPNFSGEFGSGGIVEFPTGKRSLDDITLHPRLLTAVQQLLGSDRVILAQSNTWRKDGQTEEQVESGEAARGNQRIHMDYPNHTLVHPPPWYKPGAVEIIVYFSDSVKCGGETRVLPRESDSDEAYRWPYVDMPGIGGFLPWMNERPDAERLMAELSPDSHRFRQELYARERAARFHPGSVLFYRHDLWHRGFPLKPGQVRIAQNLVYRLPSASWLSHWNAGPARTMYSKDQYTERMVARASVQQKSTLGVPPPGDPYWSSEMLEAFERRYAKLGLDASPYREALPGSKLD